MKSASLLLVLLFAPNLASAETYSYARQCEQFQCDNKENFVCPTLKDLKRYRYGRPGVCDEYEAPLQPQKFVVMQQKGPFCRVVDGSYFGWMKCDDIQFDPSMPLK